MIAETPDTEVKIDLDALRAKAKESLYVFAKGILGYDWLNERIHKPLCDALQDKSTNRKLVELPRGWLKTTVCSIAFPIWLAIQDPNIRILITQNSSTNACKKLAVIRGQWEQNGLLRAMFPELLPTKNSIWKADALCLTRSASFPEATFEAAGTSTRVVSRHYDVVIEDDTVAPDLDELGDESLAPTSEDVSKAIGWHRTNVLPLLNNPAKDLSLVVGTRWYDQDLIRWIKDNEPDYHVISRSCKEDAEGNSDPKGELTYPERFDQKTLDQLERALGPYMFYCNPAEAPILMADFTSRRISEVLVGDEVIGFTTDGDRSRLVQSRVIAARSRVAKIVEVTMKSGRKIRCTEDHHWLSADGFKRRNDKTRNDALYRPARPGVKLAYVYNPFDDRVWELGRDGTKSERERNAWFAGLFDGEGSVIKAGVGSGRLTIAQSPTHNPVLSEMLRVALRTADFTWIESNGGMAAVFGTSWEDRRRFLINYPSYKGRRLIPETLLGSRWIKDRDEVVGVKPCGEELVYSLQTETGNYICWGYASKNCLYFNMPIRREDMAFKLEWFRYYETNPVLSNLAVYTTIDTATDPKLSKENDIDYSVVMTCGKDLSTGNIYVLDYFHKRCNPGELCSAIFDHVSRFNPVCVGYQDVSFERSIEYWLKELMRQHNRFFILEPLNLPRNKDSKNQRIAGLQPLFAAGVILLRTHMKELISELSKFPLGSHDDIPDALSMQLSLWRLTKSNRERARALYPDPLTVDAAIEELLARKSQGPLGGVVFAPLRVSRNDSVFEFSGGLN